jgi:hypothetical protein
MPTPTRERADDRGLPTLERLLERAERFRPMASHFPEPRQCRTDPQREGRVAFAETPRQRGPQVVQLQLDAIEPVRLLGPAEKELGRLLRKIEEPLTMPIAKSLRLR